MSVQAISLALALRGVSPSEKLLLLTLANYADERMRCWPSQRRLAEDTCLTDRTVRSLLAALEDRKIISRVSRERNDGSRATDIVTLHFNVEVTSGGVAEMISAPPEIDAGGTGKDFRGVPEMVSALTTFEPSSEPSEEPSNTTRAFDAFWREYPEKVGKGAARIAYSKALKRIGTQNAEAVILEGVRAANEQSDKWRRGIVPNPATWLNQDRWNDEHRQQPDPRHAPPSAKLIERHANYGRALSGFEAVAFARADDG